MDDLQALSLNALDKYFKVLNITGYKNTNNLLALLFICKMLNNNCFNIYITNEDYDNMLQAINCLSDCLIDMPTYENYRDNIYCKKHITDDYIRTTDSSVRGIGNYIRTIT